MVILAVPATVSAKEKKEPVKILVTLPDSEQIAIVSYGYAFRLKNMQPSFAVRLSKTVTNEAQLEVQLAEPLAVMAAITPACQEHTRNVQPNYLAMGMIDGMTGGLGGGVGVGVGSMMFAGANMLSYTGYGASAMAVPNIVNGVTTRLKLRKYVVDACTAGVLDLSKYREKIRVLHTVTY